MAPNSSGAATSNGADARFLREIVDHHQGMVAMAGQAVEKGGEEIRADATMMAKKQVAEIEHMLGTLERDFGTGHEPAVPPSGQQVMEELARQSGAEYEFAFKKKSVMHHEEGVQLVDRYLPQLTSPKVKAMAERIRAEQVAEIDELNKKMKM